MSRLTELSRPVIRRIGWLVVRIDAEGIAIRGYGRRRWRRVSRARLAWFACFAAGPLIVATEEHVGNEDLKKITGKSEWKTLKRSA